MTILGGPESLRPNMAHREPVLEEKIDQSDAGQRARTGDVEEALVEKRAWEDGERKAEAEAEALEHLQNLE